MSNCVGVLHEKMGIYGPIQLSWADIQLNIVLLTIKSVGGCWVSSEQLAQS